MGLCTTIRKNLSKFPTASPQLVLHEVEISNVLVPFEFGPDPGDGLFSCDGVGDDSGSTNGETIQIEDVLLLDEVTKRCYWQHFKIGRAHV